MMAHAVVGQLSDYDRRVRRFIAEFHVDPSFWDADQFTRLRAHGLLRLEGNFIRLSPLGEQVKRLSSVDAP